MRTTWHRKVPSACDMAKVAHVESVRRTITRAGCGVICCHRVGVDATTHTLLQANVTIVYSTMPENVQQQKCFLSRGDHSVLARTATSRKSERRGFGKGTPKGGLLHLQRAVQAS